MADLRCYHHCNCEDRPAVARCSVCGKGLCRECADRLTSPNTGKLLCADCLDKEIAADEAWANARRAKMKREMLTIILGFAIGVIAEIVFGVLSSKGDIYMVLFGLSFVFFLPTLLASFGTIISTVNNTFQNLFLRIIFFLILVVGSPIMFIVRLVRRSRTAKIMKRFSTAQAARREANARYKEAAAKMNTRLESMEEFERKLMKEYAQLLTIDREKAEAQMSDERARHRQALAEQKQRAEAAEAEASKLRASNDELERAKHDAEENEARAAKKTKAQQRGREHVGKRK